MSLAFGRFSARSGVRGRNLASRPACAGGRFTQRGKTRKKPGRPGHIANCTAHVTTPSQPGAAAHLRGPPTLTSGTSGAASALPSASSSQA
eukprot:scaffold127411_cov36-Phaeocystis_antarctica.AAC.1